MINYWFNFEKLGIIKALLDWSLNKHLQGKPNTIRGFDFGYLVTIHIDIVWMTPNSIGQTEYHSYLIESFKMSIVKILIDKFKYCETVASKVKENDKYKRCPVLIVLHKRSRDCIHNTYFPS